MGCCTTAVPASKKPAAMGPIIKPKELQEWEKIHIKQILDFWFHDKEEVAQQIPNGPDYEYAHER